MRERVQFAVSTNVEEATGGIIGASSESVSVGEEAADQRLASFLVILVRDIRNSVDV